MPTIYQHLISLGLPDRRPIDAWASDWVKLPIALTQNGAFRVGGSRYLLEPLAALQDDAVRQVVVIAPVRGGKTLLWDLWLPWIVANDPGPCMYSTLTDELAAAHCEARTMPILETCDPVVKLFSDDRFKKRTQDIIFRNGMPFWATGQALSNFQAKGIRFLCLDEVWQWEPGRLPEAKSRLGDFEKLGTSKCLILSQGGNVQDDLYVEWQTSDRREWSVRCLSCGREFQPGFKQIKWDEYRLDNRDWDIPRALETVRLHCPHCDHAHYDNAGTHERWNESGRFVPTHAGGIKGNAGFHWSGVITRRWQSLVEEFLQASNARRRGTGTELFMTFWQKREAVFWDEEMLFEQAKYAVDEKPKEEISGYPIFTVDRQNEGMYWGMVRVVTEDRKSHRLWFGHLYSETEIELKRKEYSVPPLRVLIDSGYEAKGDGGVYAICARNGYLAVKGVGDTTQFPHHEIRGDKKVVIMRSFSKSVPVDAMEGTRSAGRRMTRLIRYSSDIMADRLKAHIDNEHWVEPVLNPNDELEIEYRKQMASEQKRFKRSETTGRYQMTWVQIRKDNHAWDLAKMQILAMTIMGLIPDEIQKNES